MSARSLATLLALVWLLAGPANSAWSLRWHVRVSGYGTPAVDATNVFSWTSPHGVLATDRIHGVPVWKRQLSPNQSGFTGSRLLLVGQLLVLGDYDVLALKKDTGEPAWKFSPADGYAPGLYLGDTFDEDIFTGSPSGRLYAVSSSTGQLRWSSLIGNDPKTTVYRPAIVGSMVVAGYTVFSSSRKGGVVAVERATGRIVWKYELRGRAGASPREAAFAGGPAAYGSDTVVVADSAGNLHGLATANGSVRWTLPLEQPTESDYRALATSGATLVAASVTGAIAAFDLRTRKRLWGYHHPENGSAGFEITISGGDVVVPFLGTGLIGISLSDGLERWRIGAPEHSGVNWLPCLKYGWAYVASTSAISAFRR